MSLKKIIVVSAINIHEGGMLKILDDCLEEFSKFDKNLRIIALVHKKELVQAKGIIAIEINDSRGSWFKRLYYEYYYFHKLSKRIKPFLWLSLHDITPNVIADRRVVYCHNPSSFYNVSFNQVRLDPRFLVYNLFYNFLYKKNIKQNKYVIVQQNWIRDKFNRLFEVDKSKIIVAKPEENIASLSNTTTDELNTEAVFFYPSFPRIFKNFETILEASSILNKKTTKKYTVILTLNGYENKYANWLLKTYSDNTNVQFIGLQNRDEIEKLYQKCTCLIFPSELETWGLPITEAKSYKKSILVADLPYAHETVGNYKKASFFQSRDSEKLSELMLSIIENNICYDETKNIETHQPSANSWNELFSLIIK